MNATQAQEVAVLARDEQLKEREQEKVRTDLIIKEQVKDAILYAVPMYIRLIDNGISDTARRAGFKYKYEFDVTIDPRILKAIRECVVGHFSSEGFAVYVNSPVTLDIWWNAHQIQRKKELEEYQRLNQGICEFDGSFEPKSEC